MSIGRRLSVCGQELPETLSGAVQAHLDRVWGAIHRCGNLLDAVAGVIVEDKGSPVGVGKLRQRIANRLLIADLCFKHKFAGQE